jgi:3',5'-cyclic AMP phosphodiesterase CpdA
MLVAQISDLHLTDDGEAVCGADPGPAFAAAVAHVNDLDPPVDLVLITGDLAEQGTRGAYERFRRIADALAAPVFVVPGNHDRREEMRAAFAGTRYLPDAMMESYWQYVVEGFALRLIALDTLVEGSGHGELCAARLGWLDAVLCAAPDRASVLFMHHPPFTTGLVDMDRINCRSADALDRLLRRHRQVVHLVCGHVHRSILTVWAGIGASSSPSPSHAVRLDLREEALTELVPEPPGLHLHLYSEGSGPITHHCHVISSVR